MNNHICFYFESYYVGGLDTFTINLINNWPEKEPLCLMCNKSHSGADYLKEKIINPNCTIEIHNMPMVQDWGASINNTKIRKLTRLLSFVFLIPWYILFGYKQLKLHRFTHLHVINGGYPACLSSRCIAISWWLHSGKKSIHNFHNYAVKSSFIHALPDGIIDRLLLKATSQFVSVSYDCSESLRTRKAFKEARNIRYIYNGISDERIVPTFDLKEKLSLPKDSQVLMMLATYEQRKGHKHIIDVFEDVLKICDNLFLVFLGYGTEKEINTVIEYAKQKGVSDNVICLEFKANAMEYLSQCDIVIIGSQNFESFGLTAVEAMKYEKPVVSTNTGGLKEVINNGDGGYVFDIDEVEKMSDSIISLVENRAEMKTQGELGRKRYLRLFTADRMASEYRNLLIS